MSMRRNAIMLALCCTVLTINAPGQARTEEPPLPKIRPVPQQCEMRSGTFLLHGLTVHCDAGTDPQHENTLKLLAVAIEKASGAAPDVKRDCRQPYLIVIDRVSTPAMPPSGRTPGRKEGYVLSVEPARICIRGEDAAGLFYGVQTLRQILMNAQKEIPCLLIEDWPDMAFRGYSPFGGGPKSRSPAEIGAWYRSVVEVMALNKLNTIAFASESIQSDEELRRFGDFCRLNFVEPIPAHELLGIRRKDIARHVEATDAEFDEIMKPAARAIALLKPKAFCIGGDELVSSYDHTKRKSIYTEAQRQKRAPHEWLALCLKRFHKYLKERDVEMIMWADSLIDEEQFYGFPCLTNGYGGKPDCHYLVADLLPKDIIMWDWHYEPTCAYPTVSYVQRKGFRSVGCPWRAVGNPEMFAEYGVKTATDKLLGMLDCEWTALEKSADLEAAAARAGDCFWSAGRYEDVSPTLESIKKMVARNPLLDIPKGEHRIVIEADAPTNSAAFLVYSIGMISAVFRADGIGAKTQRTVDADYLVKAAPGCVFDTCRLAATVNEVFEGSISFSETERGKDFTEIARLGKISSPTIDLTERVKGKGFFRLHFRACNTSKGSAAFLRKIEIACRVVEKGR